MANAFYRNSSSSAKKKSEREWRSPALSGSDEIPEVSADSSTSESSFPRAAATEGQSLRNSLSWSARITPSALVTASVLALALLSFSFLSGVIVGRGSMPQPQALELENLLSEESKQGAEESEQPEKILPSESLKFMTSLKSEQPEGILSEADRKPVTVSVAPSAEQPKQEKQKKVDIQPPQEPQFDYVLRVAAFKTPEQAQKLLEKLQKVGIKVRRTQVKTNRTTWYYVQALLRGATSDLRELRRQLAAQGLKDAMVVSEKAVPARKK